MKEFNPWALNREKTTPSLIIGLGNPGEEFENTYHNAGILFVEECVQKAGIVIKAHSSKKFSYAKSGQFIFVISRVFMNESGIAVKSALNFFKKGIQETAVAHDDADLKIGAVKISFERGSAGHKGISSVVRELDSNSFYRIRIGIREKDRESIRRIKASEFVLKKISSQNREKIISATEKYSHFFL